MPNPPYLRADANLDFDQLMELIGNWLKRAWGDDWGLFTEDFPVDGEGHPRTPFIVYTLLQDTPSQQWKERKPRFLGTEPDPKNPDRQIASWVMHCDCIVDFECIEDSNAKTRTLAKRFKGFMSAYTGVFKQAGAGEILWLQTTANPNLSELGELELRSRSVRYLISIQEIYTADAETLNTFKFSFTSPSVSPDAES